MKGGREVFHPFVISLSDQKLVTIGIRHNKSIKEVSEVGCRDC